MTNSDQPIVVYVAHSMLEAQRITAILEGAGISCSIVSGGMSQFGGINDSFECIVEAPDAFAAMQLLAPDAAPEKDDQSRGAEKTPDTRSVVGFIQHRRYGLATLLAMIGATLVVLGLLGVRLQTLLTLVSGRLASRGNAAGADATGTVMIGAAILGIFGVVALIEFQISRRKSAGKTSEHGSPRTPLSD